VEITVTVAMEADQAVDGARALLRWLADEAELRGRVRLADTAPIPGSLGALSDTLVVSLGPGGAATVFAAALISWIRHRTGDAQAGSYGPHQTPGRKGMSCSHPRGTSRQATLRAHQHSKPCPPSRNWHRSATSSHAQLAAGESEAKRFARIAAIVLARLWQ